jgi:hypothetical protein
MTKNVAEKQLDSVEKVLGELAYEEVFIYPTPSELWTRLSVRLFADREAIISKFETGFTVQRDKHDPRTFYVMNNKLSKVGA